MKFAFQRHSLFRIRMIDSDEYRSVTYGVMVSYARESDVIAVKRYIRDSSDMQGGSDEAVLDGFLDSDPSTDQVEDIQWDWKGDSRDFFKLAKSGVDMKVPVRSMHPDDFDWRIMKELYKRYQEWFTAGKPDWKDKKFELKLSCD